MFIVGAWWPAPPAALASEHGRLLSRSSPPADYQGAIQAADVARTPDNLARDFCADILDTRSGERRRKTGVTSFGPPDELGRAAPPLAVARNMRLLLP